MAATRLHVVLLSALAATTAAGAPAFKPDGPFDAECGVDERAFAASWIKYSDIDERIAVDTRAWEAKQLAQTAERIKGLTVRRDALEVPRARGAGDPLEQRSLCRSDEGVGR